MKTVNASQGYFQKCEDLKRKLYNCNANIYFNQKCLRNNLMLNYARIQIPITNTNIQNKDFHYKNKR